MKKLSNMKRHILHLFIALICLMPRSVFASSLQYAGETMYTGIGARALGMGGAFAAVADDASASYWNAAGMTNIHGTEVSSIKLINIKDISTNYAYVDIAHNAGDYYGAFGVALLRQTITGITLTDVSGNVIIKDSADNADNTLYFSYAHPITPVAGLSVGGSFKVLFGSDPALSAENTYTTSSYGGFGIDVSAFYDIGFLVPELNGLTLGLNIQDILGKINWSSVPGVTTEKSETVDPNFKSGISYSLPVRDFKLTAAVDLDTKYQLVLHTGLEAWWRNTVAIRAGYKSWGSIENGTTGSKTSQTADWSLGASLRWYFIGFDFAYIYNELSQVQYVSVTGRF